MSTKQFLISGVRNDFFRLLCSSKIHVQCNFRFIYKLLQSTMRTVLIDLIFQPELQFSFLLNMDCWMLTIYLSQNVKLGHCSVYFPVIISYYRGFYLNQKQNRSVFCVCFSLDCPHPERTVSGNWQLFSLSVHDIWSRNKQEHSLLCVAADGDLD